MSQTCTESKPKRLIRLSKTILINSPYGYIFVLDKYEKAEVVKNFDRLNNLKHSTVESTAFTQRGLYMLATIIKSSRATNTTLAIVDTFVTVRELANTMEQLQTVEDGGLQQKKLFEHSGELMADVIGNNLSTTTAETEIEHNFAVVKIRHKITPCGDKFLKACVPREK